MNRLLIILLCIAAFFSLITFSLFKWFSGIKAIKYLPAAFCLMVGVYYLYLARTAGNGSGFDDLANMLISIMFLAGFVSGIVTALIADLWSKHKS